MSIKLSINEYNILKIYTINGTNWSIGLKWIKQTGWISYYQKQVKEKFKKKNIEQQN